MMRSNRDKGSRRSRNIESRLVRSANYAAFVTAFICDVLFFLLIPHYFGALIAIPIVAAEDKGASGKISAHPCLHIAASSS